MLRARKSFLSSSANHCAVPVCEPNSTFTGCVSARNSCGKGRGGDGEGYQSAALAKARLQMRAHTHTLSPSLSSHRMGLRQKRVTVCQKRQAVGSVPNDHETRTGADDAYVRPAAGAANTERRSDTARWRSMGRGRERGQCSVRADAEKGPIKTDRSHQRKNIESQPCQAAHKLNQPVSMLRTLASRLVRARCAPLYAYSYVCLCPQALTAAVAPKTAGELPLPISEWQGVVCD